MHDLLQQTEAIISSDNEPVTNYANFSSLIYHTLPELNWVGFYFVKEDYLYLGPFQGKVACTKIPYNKGVCGTAWATKKILNVTDVHKFPGHIACDSNSKSELVIPLIKNGEVFGVLDIDSPIVSRFDITTSDLIYELTKILLKNI